MPDSNTRGGIAADHPDLELFDILVAPTSTGKEKNTIRMELAPIACWKINDTRFEFASSFVLPDSKGEFKELQRLREGHAGSPFSVFGHADPTGDDNFNKRLSDHRSEAIYAILTHDVKRWEKLYNAYGAGEGWGIFAIQHMLAALGENPGPITGSMNPETKEAVKSFQGKHELTADGDPNAKTRAKLFDAYMTFLWPKKMQKTEFLGAGKDAGGKADFQGCSEFNPVRVFSAAERKKLDEPANHAERNSENSPNRRVMVLLFRAGMVVPAEKWPCPRTGEGGAGCHKRFWSDGEKRRANQSARREFEDTADTFACRFYHRLVVKSPCEGIDPALLVIRLVKVDPHFAPSAESLDITYDLFGVSGRAVKIEIEAQNYEPKVIHTRNLIGPETGDDQHTIQWDGRITGGARDGRFATPLMGPFRVRMSSPGIADSVKEFKILYHSVELAFGKHTADEQAPPDTETNKFAQFKLNELGYDAGPVDGAAGDITKNALRRFQRANYKTGTQTRLTVNGTADADTVAALKSAPKRVIFEAGKDPLTADAKFYVYDNFLNDPDMDFVTGTSPEFNSFDRKKYAEDKMERPFLALEAIVKLLNKANEGVLAPDAVGEVPVGWETSDEPEDATVIPDTGTLANALSKTYVQHAREIGAAGTIAGAARIDADGDNCRDTFLGARKGTLADTVKSMFPDDAASRLAPFKVDHYGKQTRDSKDIPQAIVKAWDHASDFPKRKGRAGVYFRFSFKAGDDAKVRAALNFEKLPNQKTLEDDHKAAGVTLFKETGRWTVWRRTRFSAYCAMGVPTNTERPSGVPNWATIRDMFKQAFLEVENEGQPLQILNYANIVTDKVYRDTVMAMPASHRPAGVTRANLNYSPTCIYGGPTPVQTPGMTALQYFRLCAGSATTTGVIPAWCNDVTNAILKVIHDEARKTSPEGYVIFDYRLADPLTAQDWNATTNTFQPAANPFFHGFRVSGRGYVHCAGCVTTNLDNNCEINDYVAHEGGHARFLNHHAFVDESVPTHSANSANPNYHDGANLKCTMCYTSAPDDAKTLIKLYCGKCILRLRGWNVLALPNRYV